MAKKTDASADAGVIVRLTCILSGHPGDPGPGALVAVTAEEAARLIGIGAAKPVAAGQEEA